MHALVYRDGSISFSRKRPDMIETLLIATAPKAILHRAVSACARHAYDGKTLLVPGVPEADDETAAVDAVQKFKLQVRRRLDFAERNPRRSAAKAVV